MSQFDLYVNTDSETRETYPYFVDVQHELLDSLNSRTVIPLTPIEELANSWPRNLCPVFRLGSEDFALLTHQLTSVSVSFLTTSEGSLSAYRSEIISTEARNGEIWPRRSLDYGLRPPVKMTHGLMRHR